MTVVGITQRSLPPNEFGEHRYALDVRWFRFLSACGLLGVPLPNLPDVAVHTARTLALDGLVLTGGEDLTAYGGQSPLRDEAERDLIAWAMRHRVPVFGVCRGMQVLVHAFGGRLHRVDGHVGTRHEIATTGRVRTVNSFHRFAVSEVAPALEVTASCGEVVEAVRHRDAPITGIMWHPEREPVFDMADIKAVRTMFGSTP